MDNIKENWEALGSLREGFFVCFIGGLWKLGKQSLLAEPRVQEALQRTRIQVWSFLGAEVPLAFASLRGVPVPHSLQESEILL